MERCSIREAALTLQSWFPVNAEAATTPREGKSDAKTSRHKDDHKDGGEGEAQLVPERKPEEPDGPNKPLGFALRGVDPSHPYLGERGITRETAERFGVGFFPGKGSMAGRVVIPVHDGAGECVAYAGRSIDGTEPRYKFPAGFRKSRELFNLHRVKEEEYFVVVVEGFFDCMKVSQAGYPCVALMGSSMSQAQQEIIAARFAHVVLMLDGDEAGRRATEEIADRLNDVVYLVKIVELPGGVQPDQLSEDEIRRLLSGAF
jgi:DNA primase